jgi:starvation-inducible DNA-binding protein
MASNELQRRRRASLATPTDLGIQAPKDVSGGMNAILADAFALYLKTKNFHWHMSGPWIDEAERRTWFLFESCRRAD